MQEINQKLFQFVFGFARQSSFLDAVGVFASEILPFLIIFFILLLFFRQKEWRPKFLFFIEVILAFVLARGILTQFFHFFFQQSRPYELLGLKPLVMTLGTTFPSSHATIFFCLATSVFFFDKKLGSWALLIALLNGVARIFVGVHWPMDIVAGMVFGILSAVLMHEIFRPSFEALKNRKVEI